MVLLSVAIFNFSDIFMLVNSLDRVGIVEEKTVKID